MALNATWIYLSARFMKPSCVLLETIVDRLTAATSTFETKVVKIGVEEEWCSMLV